MILLYVRAHKNNRHLYIHCKICWIMATMLRDLRDKENGKSKKKSVQMYLQSWGCWSVGGLGCELSQIE